MVIFTIYIIVVIAEKVQKMFLKLKYIKGKYLQKEDKNE